MNVIARERCQEKMNVAFGVFGQYVSSLLELLPSVGSFKSIS